MKSISGSFLVSASTAWRLVNSHSTCAAWSALCATLVAMARPGELKTVAKLPEPMRAGIVGSCEVSKWM